MHIVKLSLVNYFRLLIAAMHFNENYNRPQVVTKDGREGIHLTFPKSKQGKCMTKTVSVTKKAI